MGNSEEEIFYETSALPSPPEELNVDTLPNPRMSDAKVEATVNNESADDGTLCVSVYIEAQYDMFQYFGSVEATKAYVEAAWAQVIILYANEGITMTISSIKIWDTKDPYGSGNSVSRLYAFVDGLKGVYDGDLAHLMGFGGGGGVAYLNVLCEKTYSLGFSGVDTTFNDVPTYSWTIGVLAHEVGHNLGAPHTHDCVWGPNGNQAVDCCAAAWSS